MQVKTGSYTGDGNAGGQAITGIGFQPRMVWVKRDNSTNSTICRTESMPANNAKSIASAAAISTTGAVKSLDADGFTLSDNNNQVNGAGVTYMYLAVGGEGSDFAYGTYTGDGVDGRGITDPGFQPDLVIVISESTNRGAWRSSDFSGDNAANFQQAQAADKIQSFTASGFTVGANAAVNSVTGIVYHWLAFKNVSNVFQVLALTGTGGDDESVTGAGFEPTFAVWQRVDSNSPAIIRHATVHSGDESITMDGTAADAANKIQAFQADGIQLGTDASVNALAGVYKGFVFKDGSTVPPSDPHKSIPANSMIFRRRW